MSGIEDGRSWATAYTAIQTALDAAIFLPNAEVWVARGSYGENRTPDGHVQLRSGVSLYGGFAGGETSREARDIALNPTTINGSTSNAGTPALRVVNGANDARIDGFVIRGGNGPAGGGMVNNGASPVVANCVFRDNTAQSYGGGMFNLGGAAPTIVNCLFEGNAAGLGGAGLANADASPVVSLCTFRDNSSANLGGGAINNAGANVEFVACLFDGNDAVRGGGAATITGATAVFTRCKFLGNSATERGGAMANLLDSVVTLRNCLIADNESAVHGGGLFNDDCAPLISNCTFSANSAPFRGAAIYNIDAAAPKLLNTIVYDNQPEEIGNNDTSRVFGTNCIIRGGLSSGGNTGILDLNPLFSNAAGLDFTLSAFSPAIDTGVNTSAVERGATSNDIELEARGFDGDGAGGTFLNEADGSDYDIGYDEYTGSGNVGDTSHVGSGPETVPSGGTHSSDQDGDFVINLDELLRVIQFYNSLGLHCADVVGETEDGYVPGPGLNLSCAPHDADYAPQDWVVSLDELLRSIQFYNSLAYHYCPADETEDGFCPGPA